MGNSGQEWETLSIHDWHLVSKNFKSTLKSTGSSISVQLTPFKFIKHLIASESVGNSEQSMAS